MTGVIVEGGLDLSAVKFDRPITFEYCTILGPVLMNDASLSSVSVAGSRMPSMEVRRAVISGDLELVGARIENRGGVAFNGERVVVSGHCALSHGAVIDGAVTLMGANVGGSLIFFEGTFRHPYPKDPSTPWYWPTSCAINIGNVRIGQILMLFANVEGLVVAVGAQIGDAALIEGKGNGGSFTTGGGSRAGIDFSNAVIGRAISFSGLKAFAGELSLGGAKTQTLADDGSLWRDPPSNKRRGDVVLNLDGFKYDAFGDPPGGHTDDDAETRLAWLHMQPEAWLASDFRPQPFTQCAAVLQSMGDAHGARLVLFQRERLRLKGKRVGFWERLGGYALGALAGYGFRNHRALYWAVSIWLFGALVFGVADRLDQMRPADPHVLAEARYQETGHVPRDYEPVKPVIYSLDLFLPIVEIGQVEYWIPRDAGERPANARAVFPRLPAPVASAVDWAFGGWLPKAYYYFETAMGWLLVSIVLAGFSGLLGRAGDD
jgi:hypothetical protein